MIKVDSWGNSVSLSEYADEDGMHSGTVWLSKRETWEEIKKEIDKRFDLIEGEK